MRVWVRGGGLTVLGVGPWSFRFLESGNKTLMERL